MDDHNPTKMYPKATPAKPGLDDMEWWLDEQDEEKPGVTPATKHMATKPVESHIYSVEEMEAMADERKTPETRKKGFSLIIKSAIALQSRLAEAEEYQGRLPLGLFKPHRPYSEQELVNLCCLVDRGREFEVDTEYQSSVKFSIRVDSYKLKEAHDLRHYSSKNSKEAPKQLLVIRVYKEWLKKYLDWFDPDLFRYIRIHAEGMLVNTFKDRLADENEHEYEIAGRWKHDPLMVPLPKLHLKVSTQEGFGTTDDGKFQPYSLDTYERPTKRKSYVHGVHEACNPDGFQEVPVARPPSTKVPPKMVQIKGIRAELKTKGEETTYRWLGLQGGKYVSLPPDWVAINFDISILNEAKMRAVRAKEKKNKYASEKFLPLPVGDSRDDDPPINFRHRNGLNYYYQGKVDNCVMGGLVNAVFWFIGPHHADALLQNHSLPSVDSFWYNFVKKVNGSLRDGYQLTKFKCQNILEVDDSCPVVAQLRAGDKSETRAICVFDGCIYDSASRFVLIKNREALDWCCGEYGFDAHLRLYRLKRKERKERQSNNKTRAKRQRWF
jgi:hypothetical protein